jgi:predicted metal-binding protein
MATSRRIKAFCDEARRGGALDAVIVSPQKVFTSTWVRLRCQYGCSEYGQCLTCPPHSPTPETTRKMLDGYRTAILLHGSDWKSVREVAQALERTVFLAGYYKAFAFLCGPCDCAEPVWQCSRKAAGSRPANILTRRDRPWRPQGSTCLPLPVRRAYRSRSSARKNARRTTMPWCWLSRGSRNARRDGPTAAPEAADPPAGTTAGPTPRRRRG